MIEAMAQIAMPDGTMDAFTVHPEEGASHPAVFLFMDIWGLREELFDLARRVAAVGYFCVVPNFYYRQGPVRFDMRDARGRMMSYVATPKEHQDRMQAQMRLTTDEMAMRDIGGLLEYLRTQPATDGPKGCFGYCLGGRYVFQAMATYPEHFRAAASMHGTRLASDAALSPIKLAGECRGEIYVGYGEHDDLTPPALRDAMQQAYGAQPGVRYRAMTHSGAMHGYALPDRDVYDRAAADRDWERIFPMFDRTLRA